MVFQRMLGELGRGSEQREAGRRRTQGMMFEDGSHESYTLVDLFSFVGTLILPNLLCIMITNTREIDGKDTSISRIMDGLDPLHFGDLWGSWFLFDGSTH